MSEQRIHVIRSRRGWAVKKEGSRRASATFEEKLQAINAAKEIASQKNYEVVIHGSNGQTFLGSTRETGIDRDKVRNIIIRLQPAQLSASAGGLEVRVQKRLRNNKNNGRKNNLYSLHNRNSE